MEDIWSNMQALEIMSFWSPVGGFLIGTGLSFIAFIFIRILEKMVDKAQGHEQITFKREKSVEIGALRDRLKK